MPLQTFKPTFPHFMRSLYFLLTLLFPSFVFANGDGVNPKAETLFNIGQFGVTNSILTTWILAAIIIIAVRVLVGTPKIVPSKGQALLENMASGLRDALEPIVGKNMIGKVFPTLCGFFIFILLYNYLIEMSKKSSTYNDFVPVSGYKDVFYNPLSITKKKSPPSPIVVKSPNNLIRATVARDPDISTTYDKRLVKMSFRPNLIDKRKVNSEDNFVFPLVETSPLSKTDRPSIKRDTLDIYDNIKSKLIDIMFYETSEKKFDLTNTIIQFLKEKCDEQDILIFLQMLQKDLNC